MIIFFTRCKVQCARLPEIFCSNPAHCALVQFNSPVMHRGMYRASRCFHACDRLDKELRLIKQHIFSIRLTF